MLSLSVQTQVKHRVQSKKDGSPLKSRWWRRFWAKCHVDQVSSSSISSFFAHTCPQMSGGEIGRHLSVEGSAHYWGSPPACLLRSAAAAAAAALLSLCAAVDDGSADRRRHLVMTPTDREADDCDHCGEGKELSNNCWKKLWWRGFSCQWCSIDHGRTCWSWSMVMTIRTVTLNIINISLIIIIPVIVMVIIIPRAKPNRYHQ